MASLPSYNSDYVATAYAATIKDTALKATGTVNSNVFLRKGPGTSYSKIVVLKKGAKVDIVAKSSNNWYKVKYGKGFGWSGFSGEGRRICSNYREIRKREKHIAAYDRRAGRAYKWECDCRR